MEKRAYVSHLGDEWGKKTDIIAILDSFMFPFITTNDEVAEIGSGGGRIANLVASKVKGLNLFDISLEMLSRAKMSLSEYENIWYHQIVSGTLPKDHVDAFDFVYSFDVFMHLDIHTIWKYLNEMRRVLKPGGKAFVHTSNLRSTGGWQRFANQQVATIGGFYFVIPEMIQLLAQKADFQIIKESHEDRSNFYLRRDYCCVLEKPR